MKDRVDIVLFALCCMLSSAFTGTLIYTFVIMPLANPVVDYSFWRTNLSVVFVFSVLSIIACALILFVSKKYVKD